MKIRICKEVEFVEKLKNIWWLMPELRSQGPEEQHIYLFSVGISVIFISPENEYCFLIPYLQQCHSHQNIHFYFLLGSIECINLIVKTHTQRNRETAIINVHRLSMHICSRKLLDVWSSVHQRNVRFFSFSKRILFHLYFHITKNIL